MSWPLRLIITATIAFLGIRGYEAAGSPWGQLPYIQNIIPPAIDQLIPNLSQDLIVSPQKPQNREEGPDQGVLDAIPDYSGKLYHVVNGNKPLFDTTSLPKESYERYSDLDSLRRCGPCIANVGKDIMPTAEREGIGMIKPSGWQTVRYDDLIHDKYLYNRCHIIGFQLTGENANEKNLITGTRFFNVNGMLPYENQVASYVRRTGNHVLFRVTPVFHGSELVCRGVLMEAYSVEDNGKSVSYCVFVYNIQPGIDIEYATGHSRRAANYMEPDIRLP